MTDNILDALLGYTSQHLSVKMPDMQMIYLQLKAEINAKVFIDWWAE